MADASTITMPTEPIGNIPRPVDLLKRVAKGDSQDPELVAWGTPTVTSMPGCA
jgi:hypothetical protein